MINNYAMSSEVIFNLVNFGIITLGFLFLYLKVKINSVKTVGICRYNINCTRASKGMFEYEIDGVKHYNGENTSHIGTCKIGKKYTIYVNKNNYEKFVSKKVLVEYMIFIIISGVSFVVCVMLELMLK